MAALINTWWPLPPNSVTRMYMELSYNWKVYYFQSNIVAARAPCALFSFDEAAVDRAEDARSRRWESQRTGTRENSQEKNTRGGKTAFAAERRGNIDSPLVATLRAFLRVSHRTRGPRRRSPAPPDARGPIFSPDARVFFCLRLVSRGPFVVCNRAPLVSSYEWERVRCCICDFASRALVHVSVWLVWHVCSHTGAPVITSKYVSSSCRIRDPDPFTEISRFHKITVRTRFSRHFM